MTSKEFIKKTRNNLASIYNAIDKINDDMEESSIDNVMKDRIDENCKLIEKLVCELTSYIKNNDVTENCYKDIETF